MRCRQTGLTRLSLFKSGTIGSNRLCCPTEVLDGVIALLVVHFDGLGMGTADAITDGVAPHHDVLVLRRSPAHHDAVDQGAHVQRTGLVWDARFWGGRKSQ